MARVMKLPINPETGFPQRFQCRVGGVLLGFEVRYNSEGDFYTVDIFDREDDVIVYGKPIIYGSDLFDGIVDERLPDVAIIPADMAGAHESVDEGVLGTDVQLLIVERGL